MPLSVYVALEVTLARVLSILDDILEDYKGKLFVNIHKIISKERAALDDKNRWSVLTMMVDSDGKMKTEFDYDDHSEDMIDYEKGWEERYLQD